MSENFSALNGLLLVDKPAGWSSHDVVAKVRRLLQISSVGHSGTLDPFATGLMVLLLGQATKLSQFITQKDKSYEVLLKFGLETDSLDSTGQVISEYGGEEWPRVDAIQKALLAMVGHFELRVPEFSAVKVKGRPLYKGAHRGEAQETPLKAMSFYDLKIHSCDERTARVKISCSKGSYIRSWVKEIGQSLGVGATTWELRRTSTPPFAIEQTVTLGELEEKVLSGQPVELGRAFVPLSQTLPELYSLRATSWDEKLLRNGALSKDLVARLMPLEREVHQSGKERVAKVLTLDEGDLIALVEAHPKKGGFKVKRVFN